MKNVLLIIFLMFFTAMARAADTLQVNIIPKPKYIKYNKGSFPINAQTVIYFNDSGLSSSAAFLKQYLNNYFKLNLKTTNQLPSKNYIAFQVKKFIKAPGQPEQYELNVSSDYVNISGNSYQGSFLGLTTFIQLLPSKTQHLILNIPNVYILDEPRFPYRGMHLDVARHFFDVDCIKKYIDLLALHKFNRFHWHLTDDQGWRIAIDKYPLLTSVGSCRNGTIIGRYPGVGNTRSKHCGYYSKEDVKEIIHYARERFITVIPEIEMPGHASAAIASYPYLSCFPNEPTAKAFGTFWHGDSTGKQVQQTWGVFEDVFCAGKESTFQFLEDVLTEVIELFPSEYIHIGGDECPKTHWKKCDACQKKMEELSLKNENELQSYFVHRIEKFINSKGKKMIGWDEILDGGLAPNATVMSWRGEKGGIVAANSGHDVIMTPESEVYFDFAQSKYEDSVTRGRYLPVERVYNYQPVSKAVQPNNTKHVLGVQGNVWSEYINNPSKLFYQVLPRMAALSEVAWGENSNYKEFQSRIPSMMERYNLWNVNYSTAIWEIVDSIYAFQNKTKPTIAVKLKNQTPDVVLRITHPASIKECLSFPQTIFLSKSDSIIAEVYDTASGKVLNTYKRQFSFNKATAKNIAVNPLPSGAYPGENGKQGLVNGVKAKKFNSTEWLGWYAKDVTIEIDLEKMDKFSIISIGMWKQEPSYIFLPKMIDIKISTDKKHWKTFKLFPESEKWHPDKNIILNLPTETKGRYITIVLKNAGKVPAGRPGAGTGTWLFADEIEVY